MPSASSYNPDRLIMQSLQDHLAQRDARKPFFLGQWYGTLALDELNAVTDLAKECVSGKPQESALQEMVEVALALYVAETGKAYAKITTATMADLLNTMAMQGSLERLRRQGLMEVKHMSICPDAQPQIIITQKGHKVGADMLRGRH